MHCRPVPAGSVCWQWIVVPLLFSTVAAEIARAEGTAEGPLPGQIIIDPDHPQWLKRAGGEHLFICGPGDPEGFLYRGRRNPDGTRDGDQQQLIEKLIRHGGNCIYMQVVRSHGGDGDRDHNPFVESDPRRGLDQDVLAQWERWFTLMDENRILIYLFIYDDGSRIWRAGGSAADTVAAEERAFLEGIVGKFKHHQNLIWVVGEESEEAYRTPRVHAIAEVIRRADRHGHLIGNHHHSGTTFKAWQPGCPLNHYSMQYNGSGEAAHAGAVEAYKKALGKYQVIYSESTAAKPDIRHAWAAAMGGTMPMLLGMDIAETPPKTLRQCRHLQEFFEATDFYRLAPRDELAHAGTRWVLADPPGSYIAYADEPSSGMGIRNMTAGRYDLLWLDCDSGSLARRPSFSVRGGNQTFSRPSGIGGHCAVWITLR